MANRSIQMPVFSLAGKTAIVTGATKGIGYGIAATFANFGANVIITARTASDVESAAGILNAEYASGGKVIGLAADSAKQEDIDRVVSAAVESFGRLDILVNNAGISGKTAKILWRNIPSSYRNKSCGKRKR